MNEERQRYNNELIFSSDEFEEFYKNITNEIYEKIKDSLKNNSIDEISFEDEKWYNVMEKGLIGHEITFKFRVWTYINNGKMIKIKSIYDSPESSSLFNKIKSLIQKGIQYVKNIIVN